MLQTRIKVDDLWKYIGYTIYVPKNTIVDIPEGSYCVLSKDSIGVSIGNYETRDDLLIEEYDDEAEVILQSDSVDLDTLLSFKLAQLVVLTGEGWKLGEGMDITPYLEEYEILTKIKKCMI